MATVQVYDTARLRLIGVDGLELQCELFASLAFSPTATTRAAAWGASSPLNEFQNGYGEPPTFSGPRSMMPGDNIIWRQSGANGVNMAGLAPAIWNATGAGLSAGAALIFGSSGGQLRPFFHLNFGGTLTAPAGTPFIVMPPAAGWLAVASS